ncbi:MAG: hypothetical protein E5V30_28550 [Mesorhizobium sp.]|nr:MAG: hypothetical protein E5V30_28550 [Mesorhizobium sp.]
MEPVTLFDLATKQSQWLAVRQSAIASNIARRVAELMKAGEVRRSFELNTAIVKAFHSMMMMAVKS